MSYAATLGLEEEFFALEAGRNCPTLQSMDYLRRFVWSNVKANLPHSASNFAKADDRKECFMGSIELSTGKHEEPDDLVKDLIWRRTCFAKSAVHCLIVPTGALFHLSSPTNTACSHIHVGVRAEHRERVYRNLCYFAPLLAVYAANSPFAGGKPFGLSYRMAQEGLLGSLNQDPQYRFQDVIISKRLGTIEMRIFDPIPEVERLLVILSSVKKIAEWEGESGLDIEVYNASRKKWVFGEYDEWFQQMQEAAKQLDLNPALFGGQPLSDQLSMMATQSGIDAAYSFLDELWRKPTGIVAEPKPYSSFKMAAGLAGYYVPRLPLIAYKGYMEWYGKNGFK